ncbi:Ku protein [Streptomyces sp. XM4193]|uniref:non-homologous end joining protein Ku n=1 Tax=Streptomyces sp. XM4193 TaxID=2929782 RepID=UPI001FF86EC9|nr:Ku protein [Streptomyces sp. XM4193]MCK1797634.1 Ku protein [Streptomyces sp. XM4193]
MRSIWKGSLSFGLVSIPIQLYGATENHRVSFHQVHTKEGCGGRIRYRKFCDLEDVEVQSDEIGKGYTADDGSTVVLTEEDLASLPLPTAKTIEILSFLPASEIDPIQLDKPYYLATDHAAAAKPYVLLRSALTRSGKAAVAKFALRGREALGLLRVVDDTLVLHSMLWPDEVRSAGGMAPDASVTVREAELDMAETLMESLGELDWSELHDEYREAVQELVAAKQQGRSPSEPAAAPSGGKVIDLMSALESSVAAAREARGESEATVTELKSPQKKATSALPSAGGSGGRGKKGASAKTAKRPAAKASKAAKKSATGGGRSATTKKAAARGSAKKTAAKRTEPAKKAASRKRAS